MKRILFSPDGADSVSPTAAQPASPAASADTKAAPVLTAAQQRKIAIQAYYDAVTRADKAAVVQQYPELADVFSAANHS